MPDDLLRRAGAPATLRMELENTGNRALGSVTLSNITRDGQRHAGTIVAGPSGTGRAIVLTGDPNGENSLDAPTAIAPAERTFELTAAPIEQSLPAHSLTVLRIPVR